MSVSPSSRLVADTLRKEAFAVDSYQADTVLDAVVVVHLDIAEGDIPGVPGMAVVPFEGVDAVAVDMVGTLAVSAVVADIVVVVVV